jgi:hypothetical protein
MSRPLTKGEVEIARSIYRDAIDLPAVTIKHRRWWPFQPRNTIMAPSGHLHCHPKGDTYSDDYSKEPLSLQGLFVHELCHVWQSQTQGRFYLPLMRHPFCLYAYQYVEGRRFKQYGLEQQAEICRHVFMLRKGVRLTNGPSLTQLEEILPF